jgi:mono/diheme cytochrome c family protein
VNSLFDILLRPPLTDFWTRGLLLTLFSLHLAFVLLAVGTAIIALSLFIRTLWRRAAREVKWSRETLGSFMALKSLALVLGIAPLLLIQAGFPVPFLAAVNLMAPAWLLLIILMILSFVSLDILGHRLDVHRRWHLLLGGLGLAALLAVPAIFVAIMVTVENPGRWRAIVRSGYRLGGGLALHWAFRYLHVLGAAILLGAAFHYFFSARSDPSRKGLLGRWILAGIVLQVGFGVPLFLTLPTRPGTSGLVFFWAGIAFVGILLAAVLWRDQRGRAQSIKVVGPLLLLVLSFMILTRQALQDQKLLPFQARVSSQAEAYQEEIWDGREAAARFYREDLATVYDRGSVIYDQSCAFCHGQRGESDTSESRVLEVPPEKLSDIRTTRSYIGAVITRGVPGSAMPYFAVFDRFKVERLLDFLGTEFSLFEPPVFPSTTVPEEAQEKARRMFLQTCSNCHGKNGRGSKLAAGLQPGVPDFPEYSLMPQRAFGVISDGYPGTQMPSFGNLPEATRWGLVQIVLGFRSQSRPAEDAPS